jgi:DNA end-binding protein Ku
MHEMLRVAEHIVETKTADFDRAYLEDRYRTELVSMLQEKKAQVPRAGPAAPSRKNVIDLMDILKRSLVAERPSSRPGARKSTTRRAAAATAKLDASKRSKVRGTATRKAVDD